MLDPLLFKVFIGAMVDWVAYTVSTFLDDSKLCGEAGIIGDGIGIPNDLDNLEKWSEINQLIQQGQVWSGALRMKQSNVHI